ncbi:R3H-associated N-terminal domain [Trypanosoma melophagium]|uniref:R3H-associated N-terminal domain n=1 Tax=Trypanosoma melophagium TaxID=715481 RepID=UPI00351A5B98|nr:R3H-associated N-terminal domain [Trypanosoma melophagium]
MDEDKALSTPSNLLFDETSLQTTPPTVPRKNIVPLITPRYQKKQRAHRYIEVTDSSSDRISATTALQQHVREVLTVQNGPVSYEQEMFFHPYELYKHGKHKIHTSSVGYSSECDLVVTREAISEPSDVDLGFVRRRAEIHKPICLDPKARRPITEAESKKKLRLNSGKFRKYPGIRAPKNRKERNRLLNDYFATEYARKIRDKYRERKENGEDDGETSPPVRPVFGNLPSSFYDILDLDEDAQTRALERFGVYQRQGINNNNNIPKDPDSGESRFQGMNSRLRGELIHALNSVFLSQQIDDLERAFINYISEGNTDKPLTYNFRDGYGRLVCHGVAAYYKLVSESQYQSDGTKITIVSWPKKKKNDRKPLALPHTTLMQLLRKKRSDMPNASSLVSTPQTTPFGKPEESDVTPPPFNLDDSPVEETFIAGLNPKAGASNLQNESSPQKIPVYKPSIVVPAEGTSMTVTEKKRMRKSMKSAPKNGGRNVEEIVCAH